MKGESVQVTIIQPTTGAGSIKAHFGIDYHGLSIRGLSYCEDESGSKWILLPSQPRIDHQGHAVRDENGRVRQYRILYFPDRSEWLSFQHWAINEVNKILPSLLKAGKPAPEFRGMGGAR